MDTEGMNKHEGPLAHKAGDAWETSTSARELLADDV